MAKAKPARKRLPRWVTDPNFPQPTKTRRKTEKRPNRVTKSKTKLGTEWRPSDVLVRPKKKK